MRGPGDAGRGATWNERGPEAGALGILRPSVPLRKKIWVSNIRVNYVIIVFARLRILQSPELRNYGVTESRSLELRSCRVAELQIKTPKGLKNLSRAQNRAPQVRAPARRARGAVGLVSDAMGGGLQPRANVAALTFLGRGWIDHRPATTLPSRVAGRAEGHPGSHPPPSAEDPAVGRRRPGTGGPEIRLS
jgi:hypothetical protein